MTVQTLNHNIVSLIDDLDNSYLNQSLSIPADVLETNSSLLITDKDLETFSTVHPQSLEASAEVDPPESELISDVDGETITMLDSSGLQINNNYMEKLVQQISEKVKKYDNFLL